MPKPSPYSCIDHTVLAVVGFIGGRRDGAIRHLPFRTILGLPPLKLTAIPIPFLLHSHPRIHNIRSEEISNLPDIIRLQFLAIDSRIDLKIQVKEIFRPVILIHADVSKLKLYLDEVIGQKRTELD